ncbi:MAG TPA: thiamine pyrophosphate-dependent enzyme [Candidatus Omnitrophota bacterium]|nr:thiamine pyrophosphate-dependent enzyme [Candidatus Omnitrophota bacterium]
MRKEELMAFEERIKETYEDGKIHAPIHLSGGNEDQLIDLFKGYNSRDWIFSTWRNHYHWLLSGRSPQELERQIVAGDSMAVCDERFFTSAIVGGNAPIALGVALAIKLKKERFAHYKTQGLSDKPVEDLPHPKVWCFMGDMGASCGIALECFRYAEGHDLPIAYIVEDNGLSVTTDTKKVWGTKKEKKCHRYEYKRKYPHAGTGKHVLF